MEWKEVRLGDYIKTNETQYSIKENWENFVYLDTGSIIEGRIDTLLYFTKEDKLPSRARRKVQHGDIIYSCVRPNQRHYGYINIPVENLLVSTGFVVISCKDIDSKYLYYYLTQDTIINYLQNIGEQSVSTYPTIKPQDIEDIFIRIPSDIEDQRRIASILSSLDRKIELNNKINADLEEMALAIFKNWFVDFEPFKDGKFVNSELGMIPEGWKVGLLGELCNFKRGKNLLTKNAIDEGIPVVAGGLEPSCYHNVANTGAPVITVSGSGANAGFMRMYHVPVWASDCSFIDISCENFYFVYCFLKVNSKLLKHAQTGAVQPHVKPSDIHDFELVIPDKESIFEFQEKIKPFYDRRATIQRESSRLSLLRDTLLPRLMSGEIEVPE